MCKERRKCYKRMVFLQVLGNYNPFYDKLFEQGLLSYRTCALNFGEDFGCFG